MTPQEAQLIDGLFDRLAKLESAPRDAAAERLISDGLQRAPHAGYALVQTALVQDEALKRAGARIEELEAQAANTEPVAQRPGSFLDSMREAVTGRAPARGSVPNVRPPMPGAQPQNLESEGSQSQNFQPQGGQPPTGYPPPPPGYPGSAPVGPGGSFLGNAASTAAGVIGGSLLLNSIRSMFGHQAGESTSPWSKTADSDPGKSDLARELGGDKVKDQANDAGNDQADDVESVTDTDDEYDPDDGDDPGDDSDDPGDDQDDFDGGDSDDDSYDV